MTTEINILRIKEILKERNITSKALAREMGVSENSLSLAINGKTQPRFELLIGIARYLKVEVWHKIPPPPETKGLLLPSSDRFKIVAEQGPPKLLCSRL